MSRSMTALCPCIRPQLAELLRTAHEKFGWQMSVVGTGRDDQQQAEYLRIGTSKAKRSKHQKQPICGLSHAGDIAPYHLMQLKNWAPEHPDWLKLGELGEGLGLNWGGRWSGKWRRPGARDYKIVDCPHFDVAVDHAAQPGTLVA